MEYVGQAYAVIESYLYSRQQFVSLNNFFFSAKLIQVGVPQYLDPSYFYFLFI